MRKEDLKSLWISWYPHRRTSSLCQAWGIPLHVVQSSSRGMLKWLGQSLGTMKLLIRDRPSILYVQNPSLGLAVLAVISRWCLGYFLVVDAHNEGVRPFIRSGFFARCLTRYLLRLADITIVTNSALAEDVRRAGGRPLVLPDGLPTPPVSAIEQLKTATFLQDVLVVSTYAPDEPLAAILEAASLMPRVRFSISGNSRKFATTGLRLPENVQLTGFMPEDRYWETMARSRVILDLTLMPDCLVCGAYEALALARPMVLSDNRPTRDLFGASAILTGAEAKEISAALHSALEDSHSLEVKALEARAAYGAQWKSQQSEIHFTIQNAAQSKTRGLRVGLED